MTDSRSTPLPERMGDFFDQRSAGYDEHMQQSLDAFEAFYEAVAQPIPRTDAELEILDIGCGTGLELASIFRRAPNARITGFDLSARMLERLRRKYLGRLGQLTLVQGSYLEMPLGEARYDYVVSVMTLHHLEPRSKGEVYRRIWQALTEEGAYIEGDYIVSGERADQLLAEYRQKMDQVEEGGGGAYHIDIPLTMEMQRRLLLEAGFAQVEVIWEQGEAVVYLARGGTA